VLVRTDAAGATHKFAAALRERGCQFSLGFAIGPDVQDAVLFAGDLARCEPAAFRYRILSMAARLVRTGRAWRLRLDQDWPWVSHLATAFARLRAAPWPA
jgi:hypothetical protein